MFRIPPFADAPSSQAEKALRRNEKLNRGVDDTNRETEPTIHPETEPGREPKAEPPLDSRTRSEIEPERELPIETEPTPPVARAEPGCGTVGASFAMGLLFAILGVAIGSQFTLSRSALLLFVEIGLFGGVLVHLAFSRYSTSDVLRLRPVALATYPLALQLGIALLLANLAVSGLFGPWDQGLDIDVEAASLAEKLTLAAAVALAAPVAEESLFRGLLQGVLERRVGPWPAILIAAVPFALLHGVPGPGFVIFFWTLPIGWVVWRTGSIEPGLVVHILNNGVGVILLLAVPIGVESIGRSGGSIALLIALLALAVLWIVRLCLRIAQVADRAPPRAEQAAA